MSSYCLGIDLGTTTTYAAVWKNGRPEPLIPMSGILGIDSIVTFKPNNTIVGRIANTRGLRSGATVYEAKRIIGKTYEEVKDEIQRNKWSFEVVCDSEGNAVIRVVISQGNTKKELLFKPEDISSLILKEEKKKAELFLGSEDIDTCVITCPVKFSLAQRRATLEAGYLAGFNNVVLVAEPTAAAVAFTYKFDSTSEGTRTYLVYDFGGGTFDASILQRNGSNYKVLAIDGDEHLGGKDIDILIMDYIEDWVKKQGLSISKSKRLAFKMECKVAKEMLLMQPGYSMDLDFCDGIEDEDNPPSFYLTKSCLFNLIEPIIKKTINIVESALKKCSPPLQPTDIDYVFLMGGSSKLEYVESMLSTVFPKDIIINDSSELGCFGIAYGATLIAHNKELTSNVSLTTESSTEEVSSSMSFTDLIPFTISIHCDNQMITFLEKEKPMKEISTVFVIPKERKETTCIEFYYEQGKYYNKIGYIRIPQVASTYLQEQVLQIQGHMISSDSLDITVYQQISHKSYHAVLSVGLNDMIRKSLSLHRSQLASSKREEEEYNQLVSRFLEISQAQAKNPNRDPALEESINSMEWKISNSAVTTEELAAFLAGLLLLAGAS